MRSVLGRVLSPTGFLLVACCFLLPFVTVSCGAGSVTSTYNGTDLVAGDRAQVSVAASDGAVPPQAAIDEARDRGSKPIESQALIVAALAVVVCGLVLSGVLTPWYRALAATGSGLIGAVLLGAAKSSPSTPPVPGSRPTRCHSSATRQPGFPPSRRTR